MPPPLLLLLLLLLLPRFHGAEVPDISEPPIRIGSFNIQVFGQTKMTREDVVQILVKTALRYDLLFIMEIRDRSGQAIVQLLRQVNDKIPQQEQQFRLVISERLGRTSSKEQYAFFYRPSKFRLRHTYQYDDPADLFERPPYGALFDVYGAEKIQRLGFLGIHVAPNDSVQELQQLYNVRKQLQRVWNEENLLVLGDFNADCSYLNRYDYHDLRLVRDSSLTWLINACHETTALRSSCLYDRIVASGDSLLSGLAPRSAKVFYFDAEYQLTREMAEKVSDHYPVELQLSGKITSDTVRRMVAAEAFEVRQPVTDVAALTAVCDSDGEASRQTARFRTAALQRHGRPHSCVAVREKVRDPLAALREFRAAFPNLLHAHIASLLQRGLPPAPLFDVDVDCEVQRRQCVVRVAARTD